MNPLVSVLIPVRNRAKLVKETLTSLIQQTYPDWEAIVVDDGSTDSTRQSVREFAARDGRIRLLCRQRAPAGSTVCRNIALDACAGAYIVNFDSDDLMAPWCLEERVREMQRHPECDFIVFPMFVFRTNVGDITGSWHSTNASNGPTDLRAFLTGPSPWQTGAPIWRREFLADLLRWNERLHSETDNMFHAESLIRNPNYRKAAVLPDYFVRRGGHTNIMASRIRLENVLDRKREKLHLHARTSRAETLRRAIAYSIFRDMTLLFANRIDLRARKHFAELSSVPLYHGPALCAYRAYVLIASQAALHDVPWVRGALRWLWLHSFGRCPEPQVEFITKLTADEMTALKDRLVRHEFPFFSASV